MQQATGHHWTPGERKFSNGKLKVLMEEKIVIPYQILKKYQHWAGDFNGVDPSDHRKQC